MIESHNHEIEATLAQHILCTGCKRGKRERPRETHVTLPRTGLATYQRSRHAPASLSQFITRNKIPSAKSPFDTRRQPRRAFPPRACHALQSSFRPVEIGQGTEGFWIFLRKAGWPRKHHVNAIVRDSLRWWCKRIASHDVEGFHFCLFYIDYISLWYLYDITVFRY